MNWSRQILVSAVRVYQRLVSPCLHGLMGSTAGCRFTPSCSEYAAQAIIRHGCLNGSSLVARRICRCHPWGGQGHDPVPAKASAHSAQYGEGDSSFHSSHTRLT